MDSERGKADGRTLIAIPTMDTVAAPFCLSLANLRRVGPTKIAMVSNSLVYQARNMLAAEAIDDGCEYVLWLDSDMVFTPDLMQCLHVHMLLGYDFMSALYFKRVLPTEPVVYKRDGTPWTNYPQDMVFRIGAAGLGACMMKTALIKALWDRYGPPFNPGTDGTGEDIAFCKRATEAGYKLFCDSGIKVRHVMTGLQIGEEHFRRENG